jgi:hypothetical protein
MFVCLHVSNKLENQSIDFQNSFIVGLLGPSGVILPRITMLLLKKAEQRNKMSSKSGNNAAGKS